MISRVNVLCQLLHNKSMKMYVFENAVNWLLVIQ
jgi:hypothetical protein